MASSLLRECDACGGAATNHAALWITNSSDMLALTFARFRNAGIVKWLAALGEWVIARGASLFFFLGRTFGIFTLNDNIENAMSERARAMWREAMVRGIPFRQVYAFGTPLDIYRITVRGRNYFVDSLPTPPRLQREALHVDDKISFKRLLSSAGVPVPRSYSAGSLVRAKEILKELSCVCVKPRYGSNGYHTYPHVTTEDDLEMAYASAKQVCVMVSVEEHLEGNLCRATCVDGKLVGFLQSAYPTVIGDGTSTISELIARINQSKAPDVEDITLTPTHMGYIGRRGYTPESILPEGEELPLTFRAGAMWGGSNLERGRTIHESFIPIIEKAAVLTELPIVGFDLIIKDPTKPQDSQKWGFIEANSLPWINLHHTPLRGEPVNVATKVWDLWN